MRSLFLLFFPLSVLAQTPRVLSTAPANLAGAVSATQPIVIQFDKPLHPASVSHASIRVFGRWSGPTFGNFTLEDDFKRIVFTPAEPFFSGEMVTVSVNKKLKAAGTLTPVRGHLWQFGIKTATGSLKQTQVDVIELRLEGETWIETYGAYAGDLNNDGSSDLTTVNENSDDLRVLLNDGTGNYPDTNITPIPMGDSYPSPSEAADFDNDGEIDMVVTTAHGNETRVLFGDGLGGFPHMDKYTTGNATRGVITGD